MDPEKLHLFWQCFIATESDVEQQLWLELFIYEYEKTNVFKQHCIVENRFLSSVASHLTSYMLKLIYTTICASISPTNNKHIKSNETENCPNYDYGAYLSAEKEQASDLMQILALRKFFLEGLGGKMLSVLRSVGGTNINGSRELCNVLINIFPTERWEEIVDLDVDDLFGNFNDYISIFQQKRGADHSYALFDDSILNLTASESSLENANLADYVTDDFLATTSRHMSFNEYGLLVLDLLYELIAEECALNIDANSMTLRCLQFGVDTLKRQQPHAVFRNPEPIKWKLLTVVAKSLQNLIEVGKLDTDFVGIGEVFENLFQILEQPVSEVVLQQATFFTLLLILENLEDGEQQNGRLATFQEKALPIFIRMAENGSIASLLEQILKFLRHMKQESATGERKKRRRQKQREITAGKSHHEFSPQPFACLLESLLLGVLPSLNSVQQYQGLKTAQQLGTCCCWATIPNIENFLKMFLRSNDQEVRPFSSLYLNFIKNQLLLKIYAPTACEMCETKRQFGSFQRELLVCYNAIALDPSIGAAKLYVLLEHLQKLVKVFSFETLLHLIADCVLPIFREQKATFLEKQSDIASERLVQTCLRLFFTCLRDLRLLKAFFNAENIDHLHDLSMLEQFAEPVCRLLQIGLQHQNFLGESVIGDEQRLLTQKLISILHTNITSITNRAIRLHQDFNHHYAHFDLLHVINSDDNFPAESELSPPLSVVDSYGIKQILTINIIYWNTIFQLVRMNEQFKVEFQRYLYAYYKDSEILFILVYNSLKCYLAICSNRLIAVCGDDENNDDDDDDFFIVDCDDELKTTESQNFTSNSSVVNEQRPVSVLDVDYGIEWETTIASGDAIDLLFATNECDLRKLNYSDVFGGDEVWRQNHICETVKPIFDIKTAKRRYVPRQINFEFSLFENVLGFAITQPQQQQRSEFDTVAIYNLSTNYMKKFLETLSAPQKSVGKVNDFLTKSILGGFLINGSPVDVEEPIDSGHDYDAYFTKDQLDATNGDESLLKYFLLLFEVLASNFMQMMSPSSSAEENSASICSSSGASESDAPVDKMDTALEQLRVLITSHSIKYWHGLENGIAILNALQSLLKIAESRNSCCPSKYCSVSTCSNSADHCHSVDENVMDDVRRDMKIVDVYMVRNLQSGSDHYESDIENSDDNDTIEDLYQTADEGYDADAEALTFNEMSESDENGVMGPAYCPVSHYRNKVVYENLCKIVVEILFDLSQKCLKDPTFWPTLLTQLATRLLMVRESLGGPKFLLTGFQPILESSDIWLQDFQKTVLELVTDLNTPEACSAYLSMFASRKPPVELLLSRLTSLWNSSIKLQPSVEIEFPSTYASKISASCDPLVLQNIKSIYDCHEQYKVRSALTEACHIIPLNQLNFKPWNTNGFTVSTWLSVKDPPNGNFMDSSSSSNVGNVQDHSLTHLVSLGTEKLLFSVYISNTRDIYIKLTKPNADLSTEKRTPLDSFSVSASSSSSPADQKRPPIKVNRRKLLRPVVPPHSDPKLATMMESDDASLSSNKENMEMTNFSKYRRQQSDQGEGLNVLAAHKRSPFHHTKVILRNSFNKISLFSPTKLHPSDGDSGVDLLRCPVKVKNMRLPKNRWSQLCVGVEPTGKFLTVTITLDGAEQQSIEITCPMAAYAGKTSKLSLLCIGANDRNFEENEVDTSSQQLNYAISNVMVFKQSLPNQVVLSNLYAYGPECCNLMKCQLDTPLPNLGLLNFKKLTIADDFRTGEAVRSLQENLIGIYSSHKPDILLGNRYGDHEALPVGLVTFGNPAEKHFIPSYYTAIYLAGGLQTILFLFARVVELSDSSTAQSSALHILLKIAHSNAEFYTEFVRKSYMSLIFLVIKHKKCAKNLDMLKSILDVALDAPILNKRSDAEPYQVIANSSACIVYPELLLYTLRNYSAWSNEQQCDSDVLDVLLGALLVLVREKHPQQELNAARLSNAGIITILLNFCKIHLILVTNPIYISKCAAESLVTLIATLAGAPPSPALLDEIVKLLILMHRPSDSFITHDRSKFYFLLAPCEPNKAKRSGAASTPKRLNNSLKLRERKSLTTTTPPLIRLNSIHAVSEGSWYTKSALSVGGSSKEAGLNQAVSLSSNSSPSHRSDAEKDWEAKLNRILLQQEQRDKENSSGIDEQKRLKNKYNLNLLNDNEADQLNEALSNLTVKRQLNLRPTVRKNHRRTISRPFHRRRSESEKEEMSESISESGIEEDFNRKSESGINFSSGKESDGRISSPETSDDKFSMYLSSGSIYIQEGLFNLLRDFILILPDSSAQEVLKHYVTMEILLVISSHNNEKVRAAILRLFDVLVNRLPTQELVQYSKNNFWLHLGNQISLYPADFHLVQACMHWITGTNVLIELQMEYQELPHLNVEQKYGLNVLIAVMPGILQNKQLSVVSLEFLRRIYEDYPESAQYMIENGLMASMIKTVTKLYGKFDNPDEHIVDNINKLLSLVAHRALISVGAINVLWDLLNGLTYVEQPRSGNVKRGCRIVQSVILYNLLQSCINNNVDASRSTSSIFGFKNHRTSSILILGCQLSTTEMKTRFELIFDRTVQFITNVTSQYRQTQVEIRLIESVVQMVMNGHSKGGNVLIWALCPTRPLPLRIFVMRMLDQFTISGTANLNSIGCDLKLVKILAQSMLLISRDDMQELDVEILTEFCNGLGGPQNSSWNLQHALERIDLMREISLKEHKPAMERSVFKNEFIVQSCVDTAMRITREFVEVQNSERRTLMNFMRSDNDNYAINEWNNVVNRLTHEGATWFNNNNSKNAWQLDGTEGPDRIRTRLKPCHLNIEKRFLLNNVTEPPAGSDQSILSYLTSMKRNENLALSDQVLYTFNVKYVTVEKECEGEIIITEIEFMFIESNDGSIARGAELKEWISCDISSISEIWPRRYQLNENSLEVFFESKQSLFFVFKNLVDRDMMLKYFADKVVQCPDTTKLSLATQQWREGQMSNWEYLSLLNQMSGRTYHDLMQYPIFPWILADYDSCILNLLDEKNFRKLDRPIAVQNKDMESHYINNYNYLLQSIADGGGGNTIQMGPYHYGSHYSNSGTVLHFLVRILPFTTLFLQYQDNNFDIPDRTFHSLQTTWRLASKDSPTDVKELIPEFFCFPEMLENNEGFNFGHRQSGEQVHHIALPPWCQNSSRLFTFVHRQSLESDYVRANLNFWVDLIFGFKQTGQPAVDAINVFHPATYHNFNVANIQDVVERMAFETMVRTYGQMPKKLFKGPHPHSKLLQWPDGQSTITDAVTPPAPPPPVMSTVIGLKWGRYTGSPQLKEPKMVDFLQQYELTFNYLVALETTNVVYGVPSNCNIMRGYEEDTLNLIAWGEMDDIVRIKSLSEDSESAARHLVHVPKIDPISACGTSPNSTQLWLGHVSGRITVYQCYSVHVPKHYKNQMYDNPNKLSYNSAFRKISKANAIDFEHVSSSGKMANALNNMRWTPPVILIKHTDEITGIQLSTAFKIVVSIGQDGIISIWDMNKLEYIRSIEPSSFTHRFPLTHVAISSTLGDIVSVYSLELQDSADMAQAITESYDVDSDDFVKVSINLDGKSQLRLHTVNARYINHLTLQAKIEAVCYSGIKEGTGVNVIAVAFDNGHINLYSSWNLNFVREIDIGRADIRSILYSTYQYLVILTKDNMIHVWESPGGLQGNQPKFPQIVFSKRRSV